jgi:hypothetical protein
MPFVAPMASSEESSPSKKLDKPSRSMVCLMRFRSDFLSACSTWARVESEISGYVTAMDSIPPFRTSFQRHATQMSGALTQGTGCAMNQCIGCHCATEFAAAEEETC